MEEFDTYRILEFNETHRREDLLKIQEEIKQCQFFLDFLEFKKK